MTKIRMAFLSSFVVSALVSGCSGRDVEAKGEVKAPAGTTVQSVQLDFYDVPEAEGAEETKISTKKLDKLGSFAETISVEGSKIRVFALVDANSNGTCDNGELWAEASSAIKDDNTLVTPLSLELRQLDCPAAKK